MRITLLLAMLLLAELPLSGQKHLEGLWEGYITKGGLHTEDGYKFELLIKLDGHRITGRSYIHLEEGKVIEMDVRGYLYQDRSISLKDIEFIPAAGSDLLPPFNRKYQMIYTRSIWESKLEGYWQEIITSPFDQRRDRGRIILKKNTGSKA
mgnify:CR=1 FL=1